MPGLETRTTTHTRMNGKLKQLLHQDIKKNMEQLFHKKRAEDIKKMVIMLIERVHGLMNNMTT